MFKNLSPGAIGIRCELPEAIDLARKSGFEGIDFSIQEAAALRDARGLAYVRDLFAAAGVRPGLWGLPIDWRNDQTFAQELQELAGWARLGRELGCVRTATWVPSWSDERDYTANWAWHVERFRAIAQVLADEGCRLGLEFLGPQTLRAGHRYAFIHTLQEALDLAAEIGTGNVGLLLDAWHLYTSGGTVDDMDRLTAQDIVTVHVNDAPAGVPLEEQQDQVRCLPLESGVIDLAGFMRKLAVLNYDGPVTPEPFSAALRELAAKDPLAAAKRTAEAMDALWEAGGLGGEVAD